jgi:hypothetical protein
MMRTLHKIIFAAAMVAGLSVAASAQRHDGPKKPPPKENPPVVTPNVKPPKNEDKPKPKKPSAELLIYREEDIA